MWTLIVEGIGEDTQAVGTHRFFRQHEREFSLSNEEMIADLVAYQPEIFGLEDVKELSTEKMRKDVLFYILYMDAISRCTGMPRV